uniref:Endonuclease/exonuclease/phosphatase domain-containing protein n=1 Tax=Latimeria chalumnae TaxID=7897 RepID=H3AT54_LATCH
ITFASMYAPNVDNPLTVQNFFLKLSQYPSPWVIGGDFNCPLDTVMDRSSSTPVAQTHMAKAILFSMVEYSLTDKWRHLHPKTREYSHYSHAHKSFSRIDFLLISSSLTHRVKNCILLPRYISDHSPVCVQLEAPENYQGPYWWRLDPQLLTREESMGEIKSAIQEFFHFNHSLSSPPDVIWEALKATIRGKIIALSLANKKSFQQQMVSLEQELSGAETELYKNNLEETREWVASLQHDLNVLSSSKAERAFYARGDKAGKLLAWQLRREEADRYIPSIKLPDDDVSFSPGAINGAFRSYYSSLYSTQLGGVGWKRSMLSFLDGVEIPKLSGDQGEQLGAPLSLTEI